MGKIEIYGVLASPPVRATLIVAKTVGVPYELKPVDPRNNPEFKKLNPQGKIPLLVDDGFTLGESRAIMEYLMDKYSKNDSLYPKDVKERAVVNARLNFDCGTLWPRVFTVFHQVFNEGKATKEAVQFVNDSFPIIEEFLTRDKWIAGPTMTIADISFSTILCTLEVSGFDLSSYPKINNWLAECRKKIPNYSINDEGLTHGKPRFDKVKKMVQAVDC